MDTIQPKGGFRLGAQHPRPQHFSIPGASWWSISHICLSLEPLKIWRNNSDSPMSLKHNVSPPLSTNQGIKWLIDFLYRFQISRVCMRQRPSFHNPAEKKGTTDAEAVASQLLLANQGTSELKRRMSERIKRGFFPPSLTAHDSGMMSQKIKKNKKKTHTRKNK